MNQKERKPMKTIAPILVILAGCMWGGTGVFVRMLTALGITNMTVVAVRMSGAALLLFLILILWDRSLLKMRVKDLWIALGASIFSSLGLNYFYNIAISELSLSLAAVLLASMPIFVILISRPLFGEKITLQKLISMVLVLLGCICCSGLLQGGLGSVSAKGLFFGIGSAVFYAGYSIFTRLGLNRGYHPLTINFYCFLWSTVLLLPLGDWQTVGALIAAEPLKHTGFLLLHSLLCAAAPYALYNLSLNYMDTGKASILVSCEPVAATVFGVIIYHETPTFLSLLGLVIVLVGLSLLSLKPKQKDLN